MPRIAKDARETQGAGAPGVLAGNGAGDGALEALTAYYERSYDRLFRYALSIVRSPEIADEVVQDAFADTTEKIRHGYEIEHLNGWFKVVVYNLAVQHIRQRVAVPLTDYESHGQSDSAAEIAYSRQKCAELYEAIGQLRPAQRSALVLAEVRGLNYREIAERMERTEDSVRALLTRARRYVREVVDHDVPVVVAPLVQIGIALRRWAARGRALRDQLSVRLSTAYSAVASFLRDYVGALPQPTEGLVASALVVAGLGLPVAGPPAVAGGAPIPASGGAGGAPAKYGAALRGDGAGDPGAPLPADRVQANTAAAAGDTPSASGRDGVRERRRDEARERRRPVEPTVDAHEASAGESSSQGATGGDGSGGETGKHHEPPPAEHIHNPPKLGGSEPEDPPAQAFEDPPALTESRASRRSAESPPRLVEVGDLSEGRHESGHEPASGSALSSDGH